MQRELLFPTPVYYKDLPNHAELNNYLFNHIKNWAATTPTESKTNSGTGWHSPTDMNEKEEYKPLVQELFKMAEECNNDYGVKPKLGLGNMWANINPPMAYNKTHTHPNSLWSGVYYIKTPVNCGHIWFTDPCGQRHIDLPIMDPDKVKPIHYWREVHYEPIEGRIIMFPGWLTHEVAPNMSDLTGEKGWRVSVSFNFAQRWKKDEYIAPKGGHNGGGKISLSDLK